MKMNDKNYLALMYGQLLTGHIFYKKRFDFFLNIITYKMSTFYKVFYTLIIYGYGNGFEQGYAYWKGNKQFTS